jgi:hypothetical protein
MQRIRDHSTLLNDTLPTHTKLPDEIPYIANLLLPCIAIGLGKSLVNPTMASKDSFRRLGSVPKT